MQYLGNNPGKNKPTRGRGRRQFKTPQKEKTNTGSHQPAGAGGTDRPTRKVGRYRDPHMKPRVSRATRR